MRMGGRTLALIQQNLQPEDRSTQSAISAARTKIILLALLSLLHVAFTLSVAPAHLSIDEAIYHMMVRDFPSNGLGVFTGYTEYPSEEMLHQFFRVYDGRIATQYPYLFPVLARPFYWVFGFYGLFWVNAIAFVGVVVLIFFTAATFFRDHDLAADACLVFVLATYAWEYSQAAWPHMVALLFVMAAFYAAARSYFSEAHPARMWFALAAGLIAGFAPGIRLDAILVLGCILLIFFFSRPCRLREACAVALGAIPGLGALSLTNHIKFGTYNPLSYGTPSKGYVPTVPWILVAAGLIVVAIAWILTRPAVVERLRKRSRLTLLFSGAAVVSILALPMARHMCEQLASGVFLMIADLRVRDLGIMELALGRTPSGALVYISGLKKAFLQSLPYLGVLWVPIAVMFRGGKDTSPLLMLFLLPAAVMIFFAYSGDHGGLCLNLRFFLVALPFTSILTAFALREVRTTWKVPYSAAVWLSAVGLGGAVFFLLVGRRPPDIRLLEFPLLDLPLILATVLFVLAMAGDFLKGAAASAVRHVAFALLAVCLTWAGLTAFVYDYPHHARQRAINYALGEKVLAVVPNDSVFFTAPFVDPFLRIVEKDRVRVAFPARDKFADFPMIVAYYLESGKRVFAAFPQQFWEDLLRGPIANYRVEPVLSVPGCIVAEITLSPQS